MDIQKVRITIRKVAQMEENAKAMELGPLTSEQMKEIDVFLGR